MIIMLSFSIGELLLYTKMIFAPEIWVKSENTTVYAPLLQGNQFYRNDGTLEREVRSSLLAVLSQYLPGRQQNQLKLEEDAPSWFLRHRFCS